MPGSGGIALSHCASTQENTVDAGIFCPGRLENLTVRLDLFCATLSNNYDPIPILTNILSRSLLLQAVRPKITVTSPGHVPGAKGKKVIERENAAEVRSYEN